MSRGFQVAIDCTDPHAQVRFWAAAMDLEVEDHDAQIRELLSAGLITDDDTTTLDGRLAWAHAAACGDGQDTRLIFQVVPERKTVKNRVHLDLRVDPERREAEVERLLGLGARHLWDGQQGPHSWVTLADPEGNEFCVA